MSKKNVNLVTDIAGKNEKFFLKEIKPRGLATPKLLVGCLGFFDVNIWRDVCIDDETILSIIRNKMTFMYVQYV